jgi:mRNA deadenylase 3'-5' endonuclease subunit Ccr4
MKINILSYNILAPCHVNFHRYQQNLTTTLSWDNRKQLILERVEKENLNVICLQEVEHKGFAFIESRLKPAGFRGIYAPKAFGKLEGVAIFFKFEHLLFMGAETIFFHDYYPDKLKGLPFASGDVALFLYIKTVKGIIGIVTTHIHAYFEGEDSPAKKTNQLQIKELFNSYLPSRSDVNHWIVAGDFNTELIDIPSIYLEQNQLLNAHDSLPYPTFENKKIDYIFYSKTLHAIPTPIKQTPLPHPSSFEGSDHLPLIASIQID